MSTATRTQNMAAALRIVRMADRNGITAGTIARALDVSFGEAEAVALELCNLHNVYEGNNGRLHY